MFERLKNAWRKLVPPTQENLLRDAEPQQGATRAGWRKNRKHASRRGADRLYRERLKQKTDATNEIAPTENAAPEIISIMPASVDASALTPQCADADSAANTNTSLENSDVPWAALIRPGILATRPTPSIVPVNPATIEPIPIAEPQILEANATVNNSPMAARPIEAAPENLESAEWEPDWEQECRTDLPMRDGAHIERLLKFETAEMTAARIENDRQRYLHSRWGFPPPDCQAAIVDPRKPVGPINFWGRRG